LDRFAFHDPVAILAAVVSVMIMGIAKGGLSGAGVLGVPVMALVISPVQAAGIFLPILLVSDAVSVWTWWRSWDLRTLGLMLPGAILGIGIGWATAAFVSDDAVRLIVGVIAVAFVLRWSFQSKARRLEARQHHAGRASFWGMVSGYTSMVAHAGAPPYQVYAMPLQMDPRTYTGTNVAFFAAVNAVKIIPYFMLGQFDTANLLTSAVLAPIAIVFTLLGARIIRRMRAETFYPLTYALVLLVGAKLIWDGTAALL
jgi:uncharacterized membrane protein YfcA